MHRGACGRARWLLLLLLAWACAACSAPHLGRSTDSAARRASCQAEEWKEASTPMCAVSSSPPPPPPPCRAIWRCLCCWFFPMATAAAAAAASAQLQRPGACLESPPCSVGLHRPCACTQAQQRMLLGRACQQHSLRRLSVEKACWGAVPRQMPQPATPRAAACGWSPPGGPTQGHHAARQGTRALVTASM